MLALHRPAHHRQPRSSAPADQDGPAKEEPRPWDFDWVLQEARAGRIESTRFAVELTGGGTSTGWAARGFIVGSPSGALPEFGLGMVPPARLGQVRALRTGPPLKAPPPSLTMPPPGAHGAGVAERPKSPPIKAPPSRRPDTAIDGTETNPGRRRSISKSISNPGTQNASRTARGTFATRVCYRATLASTCNTSSNPRASNDSTPRRGHAAWSVICWVCYRATLASFSCCNPSANPGAGKARERS